MIDLTNFRHHASANYIDVWTQVDDVLGGERAVKGKGELYLPMPNAHDKSKENKMRYEQYKNRALFFNATAKTLSALIGAVYRKRPVIELPDSVEYAKYNIDGNNVGIGQQSQRVTREVVSKGRCGILVDFPRVDGEITIDRARRENLQAYSVVYEAKNIVNWLTQRIGAITKLKTIVLAEEVESITSIFSSEVVAQFRVLHLDDDGLYVQYVYKIDEKGDINEGEQIIPLDANGNRLTEIPFTFVGSENNDYSVDEAPLYDLSNVNLSHYRNSADNEESSFIHGQPSLFLFVGNSGVLESANPNGISVGARSANVLGQDDSAVLLQANANNLPRENMRDKENQMIMLGARLITPSQQETAEAARIKHSGDNSVLGIIVKNVDQAYADVIYWMQLFQTGIEEDFLFQINNDFFLEKMTAQDRQAWLSDIVQGAVSIKDYRSAMREAGLIPDDRTDDDIDGDINDSEPTSLI